MEWVKVNNARPEFGELCVIRTEDDEYRVAEFSLLRRTIPVFIASKHDVYLVSEVTHWARLELPK